MLPRPGVSAARLPVEATALPLWSPCPCLTGLGRPGCGLDRLGGRSTLADIGTDLGGHDLAVDAFRLKVVSRGLAPLRTVVEGSPVFAKVTCRGPALLGFRH